MTRKGRDRAIYLCLVAVGVPAAVGWWGDHSWTGAVSGVILTAVAVAIVAAAVGTFGRPVALVAIAVWTIGGALVRAVWALVRTALKMARAARRAVRWGVEAMIDRPEHI